MEHLSEVVCHEFGHNLADTGSFFEIFMNLAEKCEKLPKNEEKILFFAKFKVVSTPLTSKKGSNRELYIFPQHVYRRKSLPRAFDCFNVF